MQFKFFIGFSFILISHIGFPQEMFPKWEEGIMEIHHINTGRGDATFFILPDGTTMLIDAGDTSETHTRTLSPRNAERMPNGSITAPEWIVDYIRQFYPESKNPVLDYALITHYHDDHFGEVDSLRKKSSKGNYLLTGITEVGDSIPIKMLLDRGYKFPIDLKDKDIQQRYHDDAYKLIQSLENYWAFINTRKKNGLQYNTFIAGKLNQIQLQKQAKKYPNFSIRNIAVNGNIWTGEKENTISLFKTGEYPGENNLSTVVKISFGLFDYFTGGDISGINALGGTNFNSIESNIAPLVDPVDIATLNHHGNRDSQNAYFVRTIRPKVWIQQNWSSDHPGNEVLRRILSKDIYPGERDVFSTVMLQANKDVIGNKLDAYKSQQGHIVVRVKDDGNKYEVYVLNDRSIKREVLNKFGPYESR